MRKDFQSKFPKKCESNDIEIKPSDIDFVSQGSFKLNTTIKSQNKEVDLDLGVIFPLDILKCQIKLDKSSSAK
ncbi:cyclic GMP-AMP synthase DncV-like nucleotidyltransferase [Enterococcus faecalis]|uniref:cyclic GMP-AMP synthase DncV-like nucleotidyltransferase n=1 Tax=Enterococcus faecalis TaxID=1351 RepID=UPI003B7F42B6